MRRWLPVLLLGCVWTETAAAQPSAHGEDYTISGLANESLYAEDDWQSDRSFTEVLKQQAALEARFAGRAGAFFSVLGFIREGAGKDFDGSLREQAAEYVRRNGSLRCPAAEPTLWLPGGVECTDCLGWSDKGRRPADCFLDLPESPMEKPGPDFGPVFKAPPPPECPLYIGFFR